MDGVFPILVVAGLFLLIIAVVIGTIVAFMRRDRSAKSVQQQPHPGSDTRASQLPDLPASRSTALMDEVPNTEVVELGAWRRTRKRRIVRPRPRRNRSSPPCGLKPTP